MKRALLVWLLGLACLARPGAARADAYRAVVDRVELEGASITGQRLIVYLSALSIEGQRLDLTDPKSIRLFIGSSERKLPYALGTYGATGGDTAIVVLLQVSIDFTAALPTIVDALDRHLLGALGEHTQVAIIPYGETLAAGRLDKLRAARRKLSLVSSDGTAGDPALADGIDRALILLRKAKSDPEGSPVRKMIIVIGDGRDRGGDHDRITKLGKRAAKEGVRIHAIAYSPADIRRPLLVLGELAKQSLGTFRWPGRGRTPTSDSWREAFEQLRDEIVQQYVITYFVNREDDVAGKKLHIVTSGRTEATSNEVKIPEAPACGGSACDVGYCANDQCVVPAPPKGRGVLGWLLLVAGVAVGAIVLLGVIGYVMTRRQQAIRPPGMPGAVPGAPGAVPGMPGMPGVVPGVPGAMPGMPAMPAAAMPGMLPNGRPIPALLVMSGPLAGQRVQLRHGFLIGKQPGCDLLIDDGYTSSQHAQIGMDAAGNCRLYDRGSTNGTFINGVPVRETALEHGVTIRIGSTELRFLAQ